MEATLISICILFSIIILLIIVYAILDYKYEKRAFEERYKIERELKFLGYYWSDFMENKAIDNYDIREEAQIFTSNYTEYLGA